MAKPMGSVDELFFQNNASIMQKLAKDVGIVRSSEDGIFDSPAVKN